jgi:hypothetical protein
MTSTVMAFDTLLYIKKLKQVGFTKEQAEVQAHALAELIPLKPTALWLVYSLAYSVSYAFSLLI